MEALHKLNIQVTVPGESCLDPTIFKMNFNFSDVSCLPSEQLTVTDMLIGQDKPSTCKFQKEWKLEF